MLLLAWLLLVDVLIEGKDEVVITGKQVSLPGLDELQFESFLTNNERVLIQWYAPWCSQCMHTMPELEKAFEELQKDGYKTRVAKVDATVEKNLASKYDIAGPAMHYFVQGEKAAEYSGNQAATDFAKYLKRRELPDVEEVNIEKADVTFSDDLGHSEFGILARVKKNSVRHKAFLESLAGIMDVVLDSDDIQFGVAFLPKGADPKKDATLEFFRPDVDFPGATRVAFEGAWAKKNIARWAAKLSFPEFGSRFTRKYQEFGGLLQLGYTGVVVLCPEQTDPEDDEDDAVEEDAGSNSTASPTAILRPLVQQFPLWKFTQCDQLTLKEAEREMLFGNTRERRTMGASLSILLAETSGMRKYKRFVLESGDTLRSRAGTEQFLTEVQQGKAYPRFKSQAVLAKPVDSNGIHTLTGATFAEQVRDPSRDYFVNFGHPRCQHCTEVSPVWDKFAKEVKRRGWDSGLVVAKMDLSENDCEEDINSYPKFVLYPAVPKEQTMKKRQTWTPSHIEKLSDTKIETWVEFVLSNAKTLQGVEDAALDAELGASEWKKKRRRRRNAKSGNEL